MIDVPLILIPVGAVLVQIAAVMIDVPLIGVAVGAVLGQVFLVVSNVFLVTLDVLLLRRGIRALGISTAGEQTGKSNRKRTSTDKKFCLHGYRSSEIVPGHYPMLKIQTPVPQQSFGAG